MSNDFLKDKGNEMERCILCGCITNVKKSLNIDKRKYYIRGAGQLCSKCHRKIY